MDMLAGYAGRAPTQAGTAISRYFPAHSRQEEKAKGKRQPFVHVGYGTVPYRTVQDVQQVVVPTAHQTRRKPGTSTRPSVPYLNR